MILRAVVVLVVGLSSGVTAQEPAEQRLSSQIERRRNVIDALKHSTAHVCEGLVELSLAVPPPVVLSGLTFSARSGRWELTLSRGTKDDAVAILQRLAEKGLCSSPVGTTKGSVGAANCTVATSRLNVALPAPKSRPLVPGQLEALQQRLAESQLELPDRPELDSSELALRALGGKGLVTGWAPTIGPAVPAPAIDRFDLSGSGIASFLGVVDLVCGLESSTRITALETLELKQPRVRNGEWVVDFRLTGNTWRYRLEDEQKDLLVGFSAVQEPKRQEQKATLATERSPFGPATPVFAGSARVLKGTECRTEGAVARDAQLEGRALDEFSVAFVAAKGDASCAMLVDAQNKCHAISQNTKLGAGAGKVTSIDTEAVTVTRLEVLAGDRLTSTKVSLKVGRSAAAPAWFCRQN